MKNTVKKLEDCKVELTVEVDAESWEKAKKNAYNKLAANVTVKGFRKGHVPPQFLKDRIDPRRVLDEALNLIVNPAFAQAVKECNLNPYDQAVPSVKEVKDDSVTLVYTFTNGPEVKLGKTSGFTADHPVASVSEEEITADINNRLEQAADMVSVDREAKMGDSVIIDFVGYLDGVEFEGGSADNYELVLGSNSFVPGFEEQLVGMKGEEEKDISITFPEQYVADLAGKPATFHVKLHEVKEKVVHPLSDESVLDLNIRDVKTVDELKEFVRKDLLQKKVNQIEQAYLNSIIDQIVADAEITYPKAILDDEAKNMVENAKKQIEQNGLSFEQFLEITGTSAEDYDKNQRETAKSNLDHYFVIETLCGVNNLNPTAEEVKAEAARIAEQYKTTPEIVMQAYQDGRALRDNLRSARLTRWLLEHNPYEAKKAEEAPKAEESAAEKKPAAKKAPAKKEEDSDKPAAEKKPAAKKAPAKKPAAKKPAEGEGAE